MGDFLAVLGPAVESGDLIQFLRQPYDGRVVDGYSRQFRWGTVASVNQPSGIDANWIESSGFVFAAVGELVWPGGKAALRDLLEKQPLFENTDQFLDWLRSGPLLRQLNGACALLFASENVLCVVTDPLAAVQIYGGRDQTGRWVAVGTHPDLVAAAAAPALRVDPVSVADFLNAGTPCCPHTMHEHVRELRPGTAHLFPLRENATVVEPTEHRYWTPPDEIRGEVPESEFAREFALHWNRAVTSRCTHQPVGVQLSGGLDSRLVIAALPPEVPCLALTYIDTVNREAKIARKVAACYGREWVVLQRDPEYVARTAIAAIRFTGCEGEWHHAHAVGFTDEIRGLGVKSLFTGLYMDNNFKAYYAKDIRRVPRGRGLRPAEFTVQPRDYAGRIDEFCHQHLRADLVEGCLDRRRRFAQGHFANGRQSSWEWLDGYPLTQACDNTGWIVERRFLPMRLPVMDRQLVDLAFRIPALAKAGGRFFVRAAAPVLGAGARIVNANDGVRPGSGAWARSSQRAIRKLEHSGRNLLARAGVRLAVPHSWHDYQEYWQTSPVLRLLADQYGPNLDAVTVGLAKSSLRPLLQQPEFPWRVGCRLVQLAVWHSMASQYRLPRRL